VFERSVEPGGNGNTEETMNCSRLLVCLTLAVPSALFGVATPAGAVDETFAPVAVISLPGGQKIQSFDISFVDPVIGIYILGDRTNKALATAPIKRSTLSTPRRIRC